MRSGEGTRSSSAYEPGSSLTSEGHGRLPATLSEADPHAPSLLANHGARRPALWSVAVPRHVPRPMPASLTEHRMRLVIGAILSSTCTPDERRQFVDELVTTLVAHRGLCDQAMESLAWYADPDIYHEPDPSIGPAVLRDQGQRARHCLAQLELARTYFKSQPPEKKKNT